MSVQRSERLMKLLIMLLVQRQFVSKERIRAELYAGESEEAFERKFERDKDELRSLGVPVESGTLDAYFDDAQGYRVRPDDFELPEIRLTSAEAAVLRVATQVWQTTRLAEAARDGVRKLAAGGAPLALDGDASDLGVRVPRVIAEESAFDVFVEATHTRTEVVFDYRGTRDDVPRRRRLQPWGVVRHAGRWYAVGADAAVTDGDPQRVFRLSRIDGPARPHGRRDAFTPPADVDVQDIARRIAPPARSGEPARLLVRAGAGFELRRDATSVEADVEGPDELTSWDRVGLPWSGTEVARTVLAHGPDVVVEEPTALRDEVLAALQGLVNRP